MELFRSDKKTIKYFETGRSARFFYMVTKDYSEFDKDWLRIRLQVFVEMLE
jgi:hypothetical protein